MRVARHAREYHDGFSISAVIIVPPKKTRKDPARIENQIAADAVWNGFKK
jgi:hypothetical protein